MSKAGKNSKSRAKKTAKKRLKLPEVLDLAAAAPLAKSFLSRRGAELAVDASRVRRLGAQCLQVLLAAAATWKADGVRLCLEKPTAEFLEGGRLLGVRLDQGIAAPEGA
jgi:chemotaxis protein CheX